MMTYTIKDFTDLFERDRTNKQKNKNKRTKIRKFSKNQTKKQIKKKVSYKIKKEARDITAVSTSVVDYYFFSKKLTNVIN